MKTWSMMLTVLLALVLTAGIAQAAKAAKAKPVRGTISKIDGASISMTAKDGTETTFATTDATTVTIKGETKAVSDLKVGDKIGVTLSEDGKTATAITSGKAPAAASAPASQP